MCAVIHVTNCMYICVYNKYGMVLVTYTITHPDGSKHDKGKITKIKWYKCFYHG